MVPLLSCVLGRVALDFHDPSAPISEPLQKIADRCGTSKDAGLVTEQSPRVVRRSQ